MTTDQRARLALAVGADRLRAARLEERDVDALLRFVMVDGVQVLEGLRGPMALHEFSKRLAVRAGCWPMPVDFGHVCDAVKALLRILDHPGLHLQCPSSEPGVGLVFDQANPETWPVRWTPGV